MTPLEIYNHKLNKGMIKQDTLQNQVVLAFEDLYQNITNPTKSWFFKSTPQFYGLYIYGTVGRGKTFLMDIFAKTIDEKKIRRQHFHHFMLWLHQELSKTKKTQDPINSIIKKLSTNISVLCLDEFLVHDITDAMLLARLMFALESNKINLITTSNVNPNDLYMGGLQRENFLPAIHWITQNMKIMQLDGNHDHRTGHMSQNKKWLTPIDKDNQNKFERLFSHLVASHNVHLSPITLNKRQLNIIKRSSKHIMFEFETLCMQPRNASDYIKLSQQYESIFLVINAPIESDDRNTARRFITLIDVLYDAHTPLYVLSEVDFNNIYHGQELSFEMKRTLSRLTEMQ